MLNLIKDGAMIARYRRSLFLTTAIIALAGAAAGVRPVHAQSVTVDSVETDVTGSNTVTMPNWTVGGALRVGNTGHGKLMIEDGGTVSDTTGSIGFALNSIGEVDVSGIGSTWTNSGSLRVGEAGTGALTVTGGGAVRTSGMGYIGYSATGTGTVTVSGHDGAGNASSLTSASYLYVGNNGTGTLNILDGGLVTDSRGYIANGASSQGSVTVSGTASSWNNLGDVVVGQTGTGELKVLAGGIVAGQAGYIGASAGSHGTATISGDDSNGNASTWTNTFDLHLGDQGTGTLNILDGGYVKVAGKVQIGQTTSAASGTLNLSGDAYGRGILETGSVVKGLGTATLNLNGGILRANQSQANFLNGFTTLSAGAEGAWFDTNGFTITVGTAFTGSSSLNKLGQGTLILTGANTYSGGTIISGGTLQVGNGSTTGSITGDVSDNGILTFNRSNAVTFDGIISGSGAVTKAGAGTTVFRGANSYTGGTTISAGTLQIGNGLVGSITGDIVNNSALSFGRSDTYTYAGNISGSGALFQIGTGTLVLTGDSNYDGTTTVSAGTLRIAGGAVVSSGGATSVNGGLALNVDGMGSVFSTTTTTVQSTTGVAANVLVENGGVLRTTLGDLVLRNAPGATTATSLNITGTGSLVDVAGSLTLGTSTASNIVTATLSAGGALRTTGISRIGATTGNTIAPMMTITGAGSNWTSTGSMVMTNGTFSLLDGGTASFSAATIGATFAARQASATISGVDSRLTTTGDLIIGSSGATGVLTVVDGGWASAGGALRLSGGATATGILNIGGVEGGATAAAGFIDGAVTFGSGTGRLNFNHTDPDYIFANVISGAGTVNQTGSGTTIFTGANSYTGATTVNAGTLRINGDQSLATGLTTVNNGAALGGSGIIGGHVTIASGGILAPGNSPGTLTIKGDLVLADGAVLNYQFGKANMAGGQLNDLTVVSGNLRLAGTINVDVPTDGSFGGGIYRVFDYSGALDNQGLALGVMPAGSDVFVLTSIANQVNLVNMAGLNLRFWDGAAGPRFDGHINGGDGTWHLGGTDINWTEKTGTVNAAYANGSFAVFAGTPGTVTIDNGAGAVTASGMQFASDGYILTGGPLTLTGANAKIRVGDGTADGAGYTATIEADLTGAGDLEKTDLGTLVLNGTGTFAGDANVVAGELRLAGGGTLSNAGGFIGRDAGNAGTVTVTGNDGSGNASTWTNTGDLSIGYSGAGTLNITNGGKVVSGTASIGTNSANGVVLVAGSGSYWANTGRLGIGELATGQLRIEDGAGVSDLEGVIGNSARGDVVVTGAGSAWTNAAGLSVGNYFAGTLRIEDGASVTSDYGYIAGGNTGDGGVTVTGAGSSWIMPNDLQVGYAGPGSLTIDDGALVRAGDVALGVYSTDGSGNLALLGTPGARGILETGSISGGLGSANVTFNGGLLRATNDNDTFFGDFGTQHITLGTNGGIIDTNGHDIGISPSLIGAGSLTKDGMGTLTLTGANVYGGGTIISTGTLQIGDGGTTGSIVGNVANGGTLAFNRLDDLDFMGLISGSGAVSKLGNGVLTLTGNNSYAGATNVNTGTFLVNGDQSTATGLTTVASGATFGGIGTIGGNVIAVAGSRINPGDAGATPGLLTVKGNLDLASGSKLNFDFGQANVEGGAFNDLINVGGDLVLGGTFNIRTSVGGSFAPGIYRLINYTGGLTDNGPTVGIIPSSTFYLQTSVAHQVNLVNTAGLAFRYWDGNGAKNDGVIDGGNGLWQRYTGNDNWVDDGSIPNAPFADSAFAVFMGAAGNIAVDKTLGAVNAAGMQFLTDGYTIKGDNVTLTGSQAMIRIGDGTAAGAGITATIDAELTGAAGVVKTDLGTLVLTGANTYTGGTAINGGVLQIASDANLGDAAGGLSFDGGTLNTTTNMASDRAVDLAGTGMLLTDAGTTLTLGGDISGGGGLVKSGGGTLILTGNGGYAGGMYVDAGTLRVNGDQSAATGLTAVASGATLGGGGIIGGDVVIGSGGILAPGNSPGTLTIDGNVSLVAGSVLNFELGQVNTVGGALNDLINIGGNLTLDGTLNVTVPTNGAFDIGVYRLFNYGGSLINNGLALGTLPSVGAFVQTAISGQVNLVNTGGLTLNYWDGVAGPKNDSKVNGGNGTWQASTGNDNWTDGNGIVNAAYADGSFAIFAGTGGTVTIDNSLGEVSASGLQFATDGYILTGGAFALTGPQSVISVGDHSDVGAGFTTTINATLTGATQVVKTDLGTLVLGGANSYTGGTLINGGTLRIASDGNLGAAAGALSFDGGALNTTADLTSNRSAVFDGAGTLAVDAKTTLTLGGVFSGTGAFTKAGEGTLVLTADNTGYTAAATVGGGTLAVDGGLGSGVDVAGAGRLEGNGQVGGIGNAGVVAPGRAGIGTLTVAGNYTGLGGTLEIEAALGDDSSATDRLVVKGATSGATQIDVINRNGLGGQTVEGIKIIDVTGASNGIFVLNGDYVFNGEQAVIGGAYGYRLYKGGVFSPTDGDWYLRSALLNLGDPSEPGEPSSPLYQPGVPIYEAYGASLQSLNTLPTLQQRVGNRTWAAGANAEGNGLWGRTEGIRSRANADVSTSGIDQDIDIWKMQMGADQLLATTDRGGRLVTGITATYGEATSRIRSIYGNGALKTYGYALGATLTWYGRTGVYIDSQAQVSYYDSNLDSDVLGALTRNNGGSGEAVSFETGKRISIGGKLSLTPQFQMAYSNVRFDRFADAADAIVTADEGASLKTRWGVTLDRQNAWAGGRSHVYGLVNLSYEWLDGARVDVSGTSLVNADDRLWAELGMGGTVNLGTNLVLYGEALGKTAVKDFGDSYSLEGTVGIRMQF